MSAIMHPVSVSEPTIRGPRKRALQTPSAYALGPAVLFQPACVLLAACFLGTCTGIGSSRSRGMSPAALICGLPTLLSAVSPVRLVLRQSVASGSFVRASIEHELSSVVNLCCCAHPSILRTLDSNSQRCAIVNSLDNRVVTSCSLGTAKMAEWSLNCKGCKKPITHSSVNPAENTMAYDTLWPYRPEVPESGFTMRCPSCQQSASYQRFELTYRAD
jgi:hypothetical protein